MRTEQLPEDDYPEGQVDFKASPDEVLKSVDEILVHYGLEVVMLETGQDVFAWRIAKRGQTA